MRRFRASEPGSSRRRQFRLAPGKSTVNLTTSAD